MMRFNGLHGILKGSFQAVSVAVVFGLVVLPAPGVNAALDHAAALERDRTVWAWGNNANGQLGDGTTTNRATAVQVVGPGGVGFLTDVLTIAAGFQHTLALKNDGTVWTWGYNLYGQLGDGTKTNRSTPVQVLGTGGAGLLTGVTAIAGGGPHTTVLKNDGTVWAWGHNRYGQLGDGTTIDRATPVQVLGLDGTGFLTGVASIASGESQTIARKNDGTVWAWGHNRYGQLGNKKTGDNATTPVQVLGPGGGGFLTDIIAIASGEYQSIALKNDGTVWSWGNNGQGQLGDGTVVDHNTPVQVLGPGGEGALLGITAVASRGQHTIALKNDGNVWTWGSNRSGQLGDGTKVDYATTPVRVIGPDGVEFLSGVIVIAGGGQHTAVRREDGSVWTWGGNVFGQLGHGTALDHPAPMKVLGL